MRDAADRLGFVVCGVVQQALKDAGARRLRLVEPPSAQSALVARWCGMDLESNGAGLPLSAANKTELLLGTVPQAAVFPLGDLYASELDVLCGSCELSEEAAQLAARAGGAEPLDRALRAVLDERREVSAAFLHIPQLQEPVLRRLRQTRFRRSQLGIVPKLGARTIGIDLFI